MRAIRIAILNALELCLVVTLIGLTARFYGEPFFVTPFAILVAAVCVMHIIVMVSICSVKYSTADYMMRHDMLQLVITHMVECGVIPVSVVFAGGIRQDEFGIYAAFGMVAAITTVIYSAEFCILYRIWKRIRPYQSQTVPVSAT